VLRRVARQCELRPSFRQASLGTDGNPTNCRHAALDDEDRSAPIPGAGRSPEATLRASTAAGDRIRVRSGRSAYYACRGRLARLALSGELRAPEQGPYRGARAFFVRMPSTYARESSVVAVVRTLPDARQLCFGVPRHAYLPSDRPTLRGGCTQHTNATRYIAGCKVRHAQFRYLALVHRSVSAHMRYVPTCGSDVKGTYLPSFGSRRHRYSCSVARVHSRHQVGRRPVRRASAGTRMLGVLPGGAGCAALDRATCRR